MKTIRLEPGGLLWRLATFYGPLHDWYVLREGTDICTYTQAVFKGLFICLITIFAGSLCGWMVVDTLMFWAFRLLTTGMMEMSEAALIGTVFFVVALAFFIVSFIFEGVQAMRRRHLKKEPTEPSASSQMYRAWKDKTCFKIDFR